MRVHIIKEEHMKKLILTTGFIITIAIASIVSYLTQTSYYPLSGQAQHQAKTITPVLDPVYVINNPNWHSHKLSVNISNLPKSVQSSLTKNVKELNYPIQFTSSKKAVAIVYTHTPHDEHALTTNNGNTILLEKSFVSEYSGQPSQIAKTLTHELGHSLGLLHTRSATIMYPLKSTSQKIRLNDAQKLYLHHLRGLSFMTHLSAKLVAKLWTARAVNAFTTYKTLPYSNLSLVSSPTLLNNTAVSAIIVILNVIPIAIIYIIASIIYIVIDTRRKV